MNGYFNTRSTLSSAGLATALPQQTAPVYFRKPANLRKWQAALAKLRAGTYRPKVVFVGDSKTVGTGAGTSSGNTWTDGAEPHSKIAHVVKLLTARGIPANRNAWFASSGLASVAARQAYDPRLSGMSGWSGGNQTLGGVMWATNGTTSFVFTPEGQVDTLVTFSKQRANDGTFTVTADASPTVLSTVNGSPAGGSTVDGFIKTTTTITKASHSFNTQRTTGGYISLVGQLAYDSTLPAVDAINGGAFGTVSAYHASTNGTSVWNAANFLATLTPDLVVIQLGSNDLNTAVSVATYAANIQDIITKAKAAGADVVLEVASVGNTGGYGTDAEREAYRQALVALGSANGCMVVDHAARFVTYASANGLGLMRDAIHETEAGYADEAAALVDALIL